jgi:mRNA-degrading endonuclease toxin of MazEF toxin-antitoxin module
VAKGEVLFVYEHIMQRQQARHVGIWCPPDRPRHRPVTLKSAASFRQGAAQLGSGRLGLASVAGETTRVLVEQIGAVDARRLGELAGHLTHEEMWGVDDAFLALLGLR